MLGVYGTWGPLGGCKILTQGVGIICPLAETFLKNVCFVNYCQTVIVIWSANGLRKHDSMFTCIGKSPLPKLPYGM